MKWTFDATFILLWKRIKFEYNGTLRSIIHTFSPIALYKLCFLAYSTLLIELDIVHKRNVCHSLFLFITIYLLVSVQFYSLIRINPISNKFSCLPFDCWLFHRRISSNIRILTHQPSCKSTPACSTLPTCLPSGGLRKTTSSYAHSPKS